MSFKLAIYFNLWYCKHFKAMFSLIRFELSMYYLFCELNCNIISAANSVHVMCICLIYYGLGCDVDLPRSFMTLGGLPDLYKWKYMCQRVSGGSRTWSCINWVVLSHFKPTVGLQRLLHTHNTTSDRASRLRVRTNAHHSLEHNRELLRAQRHTRPSSVQHSGPCLRVQSSLTCTPLRHMAQPNACTLVRTHCTPRVQSLHHLG
jgi:hypothetical protein